MFTQTPLHRTLSEPGQSSSGAAGAGAQAVSEIGLPFIARMGLPSSSSSTTETHECDEQSLSALQDFAQNGAAVTAVASRFSSLLHFGTPRPAAGFAATAV